MSRRLTLITLALVAGLTVLGVPTPSGATFVASSTNGASIAAAADWTPPAVSLRNPGSPVKDTVTLVADAADGETGIASVAVQVLAPGASGWTTLCSTTAAPYSCSWNTKLGADGGWSLRAVATDKAGYVTTSATVETTVANSLLAQLSDPGDIVKGSLSYDVGVLAYVYLGEKFHDIALANPDTGEVYGSLTWGPFTGKISVSATNLFGVPDSKGSQYYDLSANFDLGNGFTLTPDVGYQNITGHFARDNGLPSQSYADYSLTLGKDFGHGVSATLQVIDTDAHKVDYATSGGQFTGGTGFIAGVKYTF